MYEAAIDLLRFEDNRALWPKRRLSVDYYVWRILCQVHMYY